jgi:pyoverdine/dityrosine biosynthesis protein Dit1
MIYLPKIEAAVSKGMPVKFVLPAFPGKSPNPQKVLGVLPDEAERHALFFLNSLCKNVTKFYPPGMEIIICSDGRVFSDVVGMEEADVTHYQKAIDKIIKDYSLFHLSTFNLDDYYQDLNFDEMRLDIMQNFGQTLAYLKDKVKSGNKSDANFEQKEAHSMYCGITRFLYEDNLHKVGEYTKSSLQRDARKRAYEVIRRSNAWSKLIAKVFPEAVRLSIHPQACGSEKLGIRLVGNESWMTPWHGVALESNKGISLVKRSEAELMGAQLIYDAQGKPSHFSIRGEH